MEDLKIVGWADFDSVYPTKKIKDEDLEAIIELVSDSIRENGFIFSGEEHQYGLTGMPVFSDGTCFRASMRCWGNIMASLYAGPNGEELTYMNFYMSLGEDAVMPDFYDIEVEPNEDEEEAFGLTTEEDNEILNQSLLLNMGFMTTDKVLNEMYDFIKDQK